MNKDVLSTLFVGIDVSSSSNYFCAINFEGKHILDFSTANDLPSSELAIEKICNALCSSGDMHHICLGTKVCLHRPRIYFEKNTQL